MEEIPFYKESEVRFVKYPLMTGGGTTMETIIHNHTIEFTGFCGKNDEDTS